MAKELRCVLLPQLEESCSVRERELLWHHLSPLFDLHVALFDRSTLNSLGIVDGEENNWVKIDNECGGSLHVEAKEFPVELLHLLNNVKHESTSSFLYGYSSIHLLPGCLHYVEKLSSRGVIASARSFTLARLVGQIYPSDKEKENNLMRSWFSEARRIVLCPGDVTPIPCEKATSVAALPYDHLWDTGNQIFWYHVVHAEVQKDDENIENPNFDILFSVSDSTSLFLNETYNSLPLGNRIWKASILLFLKYRPKGEISGPIPLRTKPCMTHHTTYPNIPASSTFSSSPALCKHLNWVSRLLRPPQFSCGVSFPSLSAGNMSAHAAAVIETKAPCDILADLSFFAEQHFLKLYHIDYRTFMYAAFDSIFRKNSCHDHVDQSLFRTYIGDISPVSPPLLRSNAGREAEDLDIMNFVRYVSPCVVCITGMERVINTESAIASSIKEIADQKLCSFLRTLFSNLTRIEQHSRGYFSGDGSGQEGVIVVGTTSSLGHLGPNVLEHFPQHLRDNIVHFNLRSPDDNITNSESVLPTATQKFSNILGRVHMGHFVEELQLRCLQRLHGSQWLSHAFDSNSNAFSLPPMIEPESILLQICDADMKAVERSAEQGNWGTNQQQDGANDKPSRVLASKYMDRVLWDDIGGLDSVRKELIDSLRLMNFDCENICKSGNVPRRTGVLLHGPPGTGKTLIAKAVATECGMSFLSVKGPELLDMYIGESERQVRTLFEKAIAMQPCVLFFDELDSLAPARGRATGGASGVLDRVVSQLLIELDNLGNLGSSESINVTTENGVTSKGVFVIGATNRPDLLDAALTRPGRFDKKVYLGPCQSFEEKIKILYAQTKKYDVYDRMTTLEQAAYAIGDVPVTGAELGAIVSSAYEIALDRKIQDLDDSSATNKSSFYSGNGSNCDIFRNSIYRIAHYVEQMDSDDEDLNVVLRLSDFTQAIQDTKFSMQSGEYFPKCCSTED